MFCFPTKLKTIRDEPVNAKNFHEYCRYEISSPKELYTEEVAFEDVLRNIANWIDERIFEEELR